MQLGATFEETKEIKQTKDDTLFGWIQKISMEVKDSKTDHEDLQIKIKALHTALQGVIADQQNYEKTQQAYQKQLSTLRAQITAAKENEIEILFAQLKTVEAQLSSVKAPPISIEVSAQLTQLQDAYLKLKSSFEELAKYDSTLGPKLQNIISDSERQVKRCQRWQQEFAQRLEAQSKANEAGINELQILMGQTKTALNKRMAEIENRVNHLENWVKQTCGQLSEIKTNNVDTQTKIKTLQTALEYVVKEQQQHQRQQEQLRKQLNTLQAQISASNDEQAIKALKGDVEELSKELKALQQAPASIGDVTKQLLTLQEEMRQAKISLELVIKHDNSLRSQLQNSLDNSERQVQLFESWQKELVEQLAQQNKTQKAAITELQTQLNHTQSVLDKRLASLEGRVDEIEKKQSRWDPKFTVAEKLLKLRQFILEDAFVSNELKYYITPNGETTPERKDHLPLEEWVQEQLLDSKAEARVLLLQGQAGAGKSTFNRYLLRQLWQHSAWKHFQPGQSAPQAYVPFFIPLGSQRTNPNNLLRYLADLLELLEDFTEAEINVLKTDYQVLLIADGYDEMSSARPFNLYDTNRLNQYNGRFKLLISCRSQYVQQLNSIDSFVPHDRHGKAQPELFRQRYLAPFSDNQLHDYITKFVAHNHQRSELGRQLDAKFYEEKLAVLPELKALLTTPFMLLISMEILPNIIAEAERQEVKATDKSQRFTQTKLYDAFINNWFKREAKKARLAGDNADIEDLVQGYREFCIAFAKRLRMAGVTSVQFPYRDKKGLYADILSTETTAEIIDPNGPRGKWVEKLLGDNEVPEAIVRARKAAPLLVAPGNYYQFIHASLINYFAPDIPEIKAELTKPSADEVKTTVSSKTTFFSQAAIDAKEIGQFLKFVADGEQDQAEALLKAKKDLALGYGEVKDMSGRTFKHISAFQYAVWALDWHMWTMVLKYLSKEQAAHQLQELETKGTEHGKSFDLQPLINALMTYSNHYKNWSTEIRKNHWCNEIAKQQLLLPVHVVNEYCQYDRSFYPCPDFTESNLQRTREIGKKGWDWYEVIFNPSITNEFSKQYWVAYRGGAPGGHGVAMKPIGDFTLTELSGGPVHSTSDPKRDGGVFAVDSAALIALSKRRTEQRKALTSMLDVKPPAEKEVKKGTLDAKEISAFIKHVVDGEQNEAEELLKINPELALCYGDVKDASDRTFKQITAFQYSVWALDWHMWTMLLKYLPEIQAAKQIIELEEKGTAHGTTFNLQPLLDALKIYQENHGKWNRPQQQEYWSKVVGGQQRLLPIHILNEYSHPDRSFHPCPVFHVGTLPRALPGWLRYAHIISSEFGTRWAIWRGMESLLQYYADPPGKGVLPFTDRVCVYPDEVALTALSQCRIEQRKTLSSMLRQAKGDHKEPKAFVESKVTLFSSAAGESKEANEVEKLLKLVADGEQDKAEILLKAKPKLALSYSEVKDMAGRTFKQITPFQYAVWALDWHMWTMILKYLPPEIATQQLQELEIKGTEHSKMFNLQFLIDALKTYIDNYDNWNPTQRCDHWCKVVGGLQRLLPVHVLQEYFRPDRSFDPCPTFTESTFPRRIPDWIKKDGKILEDLGVAFGVIHGRALGGVGCADKYGCNLDLKSLSAMYKCRTEQREMLALVLNKIQSLRVEHKSL